MHKGKVGPYKLIVLIPFSFYFMSVILLQTTTLEQLKRDLQSLHNVLPYYIIDRINIIQILVNNIED